ncbi:TOG array regulator of axonemal microtubules protein 1 [Esox lucius]|uniref:TOG array regulator of axonemal microtubules protein 1 n=1 Tax=Esox lucius TaxID=8010 RepID=UPI0010BE089A|nr:TOG array regulator of axonemal microtubules protein 1 [Esox lucius]
MSHIVEIKDQARLQPLDNPEQALDKTLKLLSSDSVDWEKKIEGLTSLRSMAQNHKELLMPRLHDVCLAVIDEVKNLRSAVSRAAMVTLGDMYVHLQRAMDCEVVVTGRVLLHLASYANAFIRQGCEHRPASHGAVLQPYTRLEGPARRRAEYCLSLLSHHNAAVRGSAAEHLKSLVEVMGAAHILSGKKDLTIHFLIAVSKLAVDPAQYVRSETNYS